MIGRFLGVVGVVTVVILSATSSAWAGSPTDDLRGYVDRVIAVLEASDMKGPGLSAERHHAVRTIAGEGMDFLEASRRALGGHWEGRTPGERAQFVALFTALIDTAYLSKVAGYNGERLRYDGESVNGGDAVVKARVIEKDGDVTPIEFRLIRGIDDRWRVWDATFEGVSLVGNYRAQFTRIMRSSSFQQLLGRLESRTRNGSSD